MPEGSTFRAPVQRIFKRCFAQPLKAAGRTLRAGWKVIYPLVTFRRGRVWLRQKRNPKLSRLYLNPSTQWLRTFRRRRKNWYDQAMPQVSIIILNFNKAALTHDCVDALLYYTSGFRYEIILVDNGSRPEEYEPLLALGNKVKLLRLSQNRFFGEGNNIGAELAKGEYLVFMNNDVIVTRGWLEPLIDVLKTHADAGAVGPKFLYPDGRLQEAGALIDSEGRSVQLGKYGSPRNPQFNQVRAVDYCSAATLLMRRQHFEQILGFDLMWEPAYYEDVDLCLKLLALGLKTYYTPHAAVFHVENATSSDPSHGLQLHNIVEINRLKFMKRWGAFLASKRETERVPFVPKIDQRPTAAVYSPYALVPGGGESVLLSIAETLSQTHRVVLLTPERYSKARLQGLGRDLQLDLDRVELCKFDEWNSAHPVDFFLAMSNELVPPVAGIGKRNVHLCQFPFPFPFSEHEYHYRLSFRPTYHQTVVYSPFVRDHILAQVRQAGLAPQPVSVLWPPVNRVPPKAVGSSAKEAWVHQFGRLLAISDRAKLSTRDPIILHVGRFFTGGHCKRQDYLIEAFRRMTEQGVRAELHFVGSVHADPQHREYFVNLQNLAKGLSIHFHPNASVAELHNLYRDALVYWHATGIDVDPAKTPECCEHFGISVVEAMSAGCVPVVVDKGGPATIIQEGRTGFKVNDIAGFQQVTTRILREKDASWVARIQQRARLASEEYSKARFVETVLDVAASPSSVRKAA